MKQTIVGNGNAQISGHHNTVHQVPSPHVANYETTLVQQLRSPWAIAKSAAPLGAFSLLIGAVGYVGSWASILSWFGVESHAANAVEIGLWILGLATLAVGVWLVYLAYTVDHRTQYRWREELYKKQVDGSVAIYKISAKCPIDGCPGTLILKEPPTNKNGVWIAGICSKHDTRHMFEFNEETFQGSRIERLTPAN